MKLRVARKVWRLRLFPGYKFKTVRAAFHRLLRKNCLVRKSIRNSRY